MVEVSRQEVFMTYLEVLLLIQERQEKILSQDMQALITDQHRYLRDSSTSDSPWQEDPEPGKPEQRFGRGGCYYVWLQVKDCTPLRSQT